MAHAARHGGRLDRKVRKILCAWPFVHGRIGEEHGVVLRDHHVDAERQVAGLGIEHLAHFLDGLRKSAGHARNHRIAVAERHKQ